MPLSRTRIVAGLLALALTAICHAQSASQPWPDPGLRRHIAAMVRSKFNVPQSYAITLGERGPSTVPGYNALPITVSRAGKPATVLDFLISTNGKTLARLETFDLANDPAFSIDVTGRPVRGNPLAKVTLVDFDDLECPVCSRMHQALFPSTLERYKDKVRFVYKDNPLTELHPWAMHAAVDANCLAAQSGDVYWAYVDYLHNHGQEVTGPDRKPEKSYAALDRIARQEATLGKIDGSQLESCLARQDEAPVRASLKEAEALGLDFAPAVFINGERIEGNIPEEQIWWMIDQSLRDAGVEPPTAPAKAQQPAGSGQ